MKSNEKKKENDEEKRAEQPEDLEENLEKELVHLIATIVVEKTLKDARQKGNNISEI